MIKNIYITRSLGTLALAFLLVMGTGCGKKKKLAEANTPPAGETLIKEYCVGEEYMSDKKTFRVSGLGESMDQATAKKKAMSNARAEIAANLEVTLNAVVDNYVNSRESNNVEDLNERFESLTRELIDQQINGLKTICQKVVMVNSTGNYKYYIAMELSGEDIVADYNKRLTKDELLKIDYDYERFREVFDEEMEKMSNRR